MREPLQSGGKPITAALRSQRKTTPVHRSAKRTRVLFLAGTLLVLDSQPGIAQRPTTSERRDLANFGGDVWALWSSPARIERRDLAPVGAALGAVAVATLADSTIGAWIAGHQDALVIRLLAPVRGERPFGVNQLPTSPILPVLAVTSYAAGRLTRNATLSDAGLGCGAAWVGTVGLRVVTYSTIGRERPGRSPTPFHLTMPGSSDWNMQSFVGGHVANATACGAFLARRYSLGMAEPLPYAFAAVIAVGRMADGQHWTSDTVAGALMGYAIGSFTAQRQLARTPRQPGVGAVSPVSVPLFRAHFVF